MAQIELFWETVWPCLHKTLDHLTAQRNGQLTKEVRAGLNFFIILGSACLMEGILETTLKEILRHRRSIYNNVEILDFRTRKDMNIFYNRLERDLEERISKSVGASGYDEMFELLIGTELSKFKHVKPYWEGLTVLFHFRNALGHGREVMARKITAYDIEESEGEYFKGAYRRVEDYLRKKKFLTAKFIERHSEYLFLGDAIADHFRDLAISLPIALVRSLPEEESRKVQTALAPLA